MSLLCEMEKRGYRIYQEWSSYMINWVFSVRLLKLNEILAYGWRIAIPVIPVPAKINVLCVIRMCQRHDGLIYTSLQDVTQLQYRRDQPYVCARAVYHYTARHPWPSDQRWWIRASRGFIETFSPSLMRSFEWISRTRTYMYIYASMWSINIC